jgi:hypothetical protein
MNTPNSPIRVTQIPIVAGLVLLGLGAVVSCASTARPTQEVDHTPNAVLRDTPTAPPTEPQPDAQGQGQSQHPTIPESAEPSTQPTAQAHPSDDAERELRMALEQSRGLAKAQREELKALYRRLHIELDTQGRTALIVELFRDQRTELKLLGFELADRDLSASTTLGDTVVQSLRTLLTDGDASIRAKAARLITRLVPPDGMLILTDAIKRETNPGAVEPMLMGIARWPNTDAVDAVRAWAKRDDAPLAALCSAAWSMEQEGLWDPEVDHPLLLERLRGGQPGQLREDGMKLLAKLGSSDDLRGLIELMLSEDPSVVRWSAAALVETPRAVEVLTQAALENEVLYQAACEALIKHRATPEGLRRLSELPQSDPLLREQMLLRMGEVIDPERLGEAVRLAQLNPEYAIGLLSRLISSEQTHTARSAKGVLQLAELQLDAGRPNRALEAILTLEGATVDPVDRLRMDTMKTQSLVLLNRLDEAAQISLSLPVWEESIRRAFDDAQRGRIASFLLNRTDLEFNAEQRARLQLLSDAGNRTQEAPEEPTSEG